MTITLPALNGIRLKSRSLLSTNNLREIARAVNEFSFDNKDRYPRSVATVIGSQINWWVPQRMVGPKLKIDAPYRAMSTYLGEYVPNVDILHCPSAPYKFDNIQEMWNAGEEWRDSTGSLATYSNTYCFYWNYLGIVDNNKELEIPVEPYRKFLGPWGPASTGKYSKLVVSDFYGYGQGINVPEPGSYSSCEKFNGSIPSEHHDTHPPRWIQRLSDNSEFPVPPPDIRLRAAFTDEHIETYGSSEVVPMWVIKKVSPSLEPWEVADNDRSAGIFYIPRTALPN